MQNRQIVLGLSRLASLNSAPPEAMQRYAAIKAQIEALDRPVTREEWITWANEVLGTGDSQGAGA